MKDKRLRAMLVDCILFYKKTYNSWYERPFTHEELLNTNVDCENLSVKSCMELCTNLGKNPKQVYVFPRVSEDYDGYPEHFIEIYTNRKSSDAEWFEEISDALSPKWEKERYDTYLRLKEEFE